MKAHEKYDCWYFCLPSSKDTYHRRSHCPTYDINCEKTSTHHFTTRACPAYFHIFDLHKPAGLMYVCLRSSNATRRNIEFSADTALVLIKKKIISTFYHSKIHVDPNCPTVRRGHNLNSVILQVYLR